MKTKALISFFLILCIVTLSSCRSTGKKQANDGFTNKYVKVLGGTVPLRSDESLTHEKAESSGLNYVEDNDTSSFTVSEAKDSKTTAVGYPKIAVSDYSSSDIPLYNYNVLDFGAKGDGKTDDTNAFQKALSKAGAMGGGTVYAPEGKYCIKGVLSIPQLVTLRGDFRTPDDDSKGAGTVLLSYNGKNDKKARAFITLETSAALVGVIVYYPEQKVEDEAIVYPPTVAFEANGATFAMVRDCWFVNSYYMIDFGNARASGCHYVRNFFGSPLKQGINIDYCYDSGRIEGVYFSPQYWLRAQELGIAESLSARENKKAFEYIKKNSVGMSLYYSDWENIYNYNVDSLSVGINFPDVKERRANIQMSHSVLYHCNVGISLDEISSVGSMISNSTVIASGEDGIAVLSPAKNDAYPVLFNNCILESENDSAVVMIGNGILQFVNCSFKTAKNTGYAVDLRSNGSIYIEQSVFEDKEKHIHVGKNTHTAQIIGCSYPNEPDVNLEREEGFKVSVKTEPLNLPKQSGFAHQYKKSEPNVKNAQVYYLMKYGAKAGADCTAALKKALKDAAATGGIIYVPAGDYKLSDSITVPSGVEIRGCATGTMCIQTDTGGKKLKGTVFFAEVKPGENGEALFKLESESGISGFSVYYPNQKITSGVAVSYPYTVQGLGDGIWIKNICLVNSYKGIDLSTYSSKNHYVWQVTGSPLKVGMNIGNNSGNGWVEFATFNPGYWRNLKSFYTCEKEDDILNYELDNLDAYIFGDNYAEHVLGTNVYGANRAFVAEKQHNKLFNGLVIGHSVDNAVRAFVVSDCDKAEFVNSTLTVIDHSPDIVFLDVEKTNTGKAEFYNLLMFGQSETSKKSVVFSGGKNVLQEGYFFQASKNLLGLIDGGEINVSAMLLKASATHFQIEPGVTEVSLVGNFATPANTNIKIGDDVLSIVNNAGNKLKLKENLFR